VLRSVCRRFRYISAELDFWYQPGFRFTDLVAYPGPTRVPFRVIYLPYQSSLRRVGEEGLLKLLLADANLADSLGRRKTEWVFEGLEGLIVVMQDVPLFNQNARTIGLWITEDISIPRAEPVDTAIDMLAVCSRVTTLSICEAWSVNLSGISSTKFPFLENLSCLDIHHTFDGSLDELSGLQTLHMRAPDRAEKTIRRPWLPLQSTKTLTTLSLNFSQYSPLSSFDLNSLNEFVNLKSLKIGPLHPDICDFLIGFQCQLDVFELSILSDVGINKIVSMFHASCLRTVREFRLSDHPDENGDQPEWYSQKHYWHLVFDAFTYILSSVEQVKVDAAFHLECCAYFSRLRNLKLLHWDGSRYLPFGCKSDENPKEEVEKALESAFSEFRQKPRFRCMFEEGDYLYRRWPRYRSFS